MTVKNNHQHFLNLRKEYSFFEYQSYSFSFINGNLVAEFCFSLSGKVSFKPTITIPSRDFYLVNLDKTGLDNFVFHIGMVELISYWKAACSPRVIIKPHKLNQDQISWWKKLYFNGLGEFFYLNGIETDQDVFMSISSQGVEMGVSTTKLDDNKVVIPIGGGKDSVVTLELLKNKGIKVIPMIVNPREASIRTIETAGFNENQSVIVQRKIDGKLLELNSQGFLNGHTPFSALLAFTGVLSCVIAGVSNIALSNESSANESTVPGSKINHQYSKSFEFEDDFNQYVKKYLNPNINYFSFLRPVNELQIAKLFSGFPQHFNGFRSCNVGSSTDSWCGMCPKCLFTFIILSPFVEVAVLQNIFGKDMLNDPTLEDIFKELAGIADIKPFECVGTPDEVMAALAKYSNNNFDDVVLLKNIDLKNKINEFQRLISEYNTEHLLSERFESILKNELND